MIAIIPARGGSKGLPGKNIRLLEGRPLIAHSIACAMQAKCIDRIIVSTDDEKIADVSRQFGAEIPFMRPAELATDTACAVDNYIYTIDRLSRECGKNIDEFVVLLPTAPLRISEDIDGAVKIFKDKSADSVISYTPETHPIRWNKYLDSNGAFENIFDDNLSNRQDLRRSYYPNGAVYVFRTSLIKMRKYYSDKSYAYVMPRSRSVDIDTLEDFEFAEYLMRKNRS